MIIKCKVCGEKKEHRAKGMCKKCYEREYQRNSEVGKRKNKMRAVNLQIDRLKRKFPIIRPHKIEIQILHLEHKLKGMMR